MAPHSSTFAWKIPWTEKPGRLQSMGSRESDTTERLHFHFSLLCIGEGNGNPLQCSCLENPRDREAWWAAFNGVTQSWRQLKRLSSSSSGTMLWKSSNKLFELPNNTLKLIGKAGYQGPSHMYFQTICIFLQLLFHHLVIQWFHFAFFFFLMAT